MVSNLTTELDSRFFWFPLHAGDFLSKTTTLSYGEIGVYILFLIYLTRHNTIPFNEKLIRAIAKNARKKTITNALALLDKTKRGYISKDIKAHKLNAETLSEKRSRAGKLGAVKKWEKENEKKTEFNTETGEVN